jgi:hypothetical protein
VAGAGSASPTRTPSATADHGAGEDDERAVKNHAGDRRMFSGRQVSPPNLHELCATSPRGLRRVSTVQALDGGTQGVLP